MLPLPTIASRLMSSPGFSFPKTIAKLEHIIGDPQGPPGVALGIISTDPMLSGWLLSQANQASQGVTRLSEAITAIGAGAVLGAARDFQPVPDSARTTVAGCWQLSDASGRMLRLVARTVVRRSPTSPLSYLDDETLYSIGLLHDLGSALAVVRFPMEYARSLCRQEAGAGPFHDLLKQELGADTGDLGYLLARSWSLPPLLSSCMRYHLRPMRAEQHREAVCALHVARSLVRGLGFVAGPDRFLDDTDEDAYLHLGLRLDDIPPLLDRFYTEWEQQELFEIGSR
jgi:HD-like signal output (HDOD) protein